MPPYPTSDLIRDFCSAMNAKDVKKLNLLLAEDCLFMDLIFYMPFGGKQNVINFLTDVMDAMGPNVRFAIDTLTEQEKFTATVSWHLEWKTKEIPFTTCCFFFECEPNQGKLFIRKIIGLEELPVKPGELVLKVLKGASSMFDNFPMAADGLLQKMQGRGGGGGGLQMLLDLLASKTKDDRPKK
ncbi:PREDICTED: uncharacterized protein LOC104813701 isoform X2 [Tarenaya hassleriana]|nr:PREDICTED: uncharacterized protein LOC104813701 isoform X2 [Tarenaya hassleriana]XP_010539715.1 PREDICTED: uncharacterized protein LOC104813701 isoform X2 [Tarenaya hassleriana]XP_010539716.1 PREDICTED: uncharacterized protein LOC104813701 isoform X2 [Tarenaya hassleriana]XP_010539717.1 PREDICTED: uncharacterized protein LOC104813701 isoform X2 [Tarenaya hassleriana]XP_010539718.1 PREDICTED: uncharacterized protein LOC104813701 isoform X2 [Tarenaya hassleriana]